MFKSKVIYLNTALIFVWFWQFTTPYVSFGPQALAEFAFFEGGILNPPGYPLFTFFSEIFKNNIFVNAALRPSFLACFAGAITFLLLNKTLKFWLTNKKDDLLQSSLTLFIFLGFLASPLTISQFSHLEKYSISAMFFSLLFYYFSKLFNRNSISNKNIFIFFLIVGFSLCAHYSYSAIALLFTISLLFNFRKYLNLNVLFVSIFGFLIGLLPFLFLVFSSLRDPILDWGNPENLNNLLDTVSRKQYSGLEIPLTWNYFKHQVQLQYSLISEWNMIILIILSLPGLYFASLKNKKLLIILISLFALGEAIATFVRFYDPLSGTEGINIGFNRMMMPFFLPWYLLVITLSAIGLITIFAKLSNIRFKSLFTIIVVMLSSVGVYKQIKRGKYPAVIPELIKNIDAVVDENTQIITSIDAIYFGLINAQRRGDFKKNVPIIHASLINTSWYFSLIQRLYPNIKETPLYSSWQVFDQAIRAYEQDNKTPSEKTYLALNKFVADLTSHKEKSLVLSSPQMMPLPLYLTEGFQRQPFIIGFWLYKNPIVVQTIPWDKWQFSEAFSGKNIDGFPWVFSYRAMIRENWTYRKPLENILFPENIQYIQNFEKLISP
ncbi:MAG: DUF2723 domain-containing protein [Bdellovibrionaceae bacterium]|nr:DUF2723 domain-containing protein [Pseudobdellovibrionaceae bacterium]